MGKGTNPERRGRRGGQFFLFQKPAFKGFIECGWKLMVIRKEERSILNARRKPY